MDINCDIIRIVRIFMKNLGVLVELWYYLEVISVSINHEEEQLVVFRLGQEFYGINIFQVKEIIRFLDITKVPSVDDQIEGIINLRGKIIPIVDLKKSFNLKAADLNENLRIVIVEIQGQTVGLIVDEVEEVTKLAAESVEMPPTLTGTMSKYIKGVGKVKERLLLLLELDNLISVGKLEQFQEAI